MPYLLGVDIGASTVRAAVCRRAGIPTAGGPVVAGAWGPAEPVELDPAPPVVAGAGASGPGLLRLVGDEMSLPGSAPSHVLVAELARGALDAVWHREGESPDRVAVAYPTGWGPGRVGLLRSALDRAGMGGVALVTGARAVVDRHQAAGRLPVAGRVLAVCRIGAAGIEISLVIPHQPGRLELLGSAEIDDFGGPELAEADPAGAQAIVRAAVELALHTVAVHGVTPADLTAVLVAGGGAAHPLVTEMLSAAIPAPVVRDDDPRLTVACGAALAARPPMPGFAPVSLIAAPPASAAREGVATVVVTQDQIGLSRPGPGERPARPPVQVAAPPAGRK